MARVGGRNAGFAWVVGVAALAAVGVLVWLALPLVAPSASWLGGRPSASPAPEASGGVDTCRALYSEALWSYLTQTADGVPTQDTSPPVTTATEFAASLDPQVRFTCTWTSDEGTVTTTVASVAADAGAIALSALPPLGFTCDSPTGRVRCSRGDDTTGEQIDLADGVWVSSSLSGWEPERYASRVAEKVFTPGG